MKALARCLRAILSRLLASSPGAEASPKTGRNRPSILDLMGDH